MNQVVETILHRRAIRRFEPEQIGEETLQQILQAGLYAPSAGGRQGPLFVVSQDREVNLRLGRIKRANSRPRMAAAGSYVSQLTNDITAIQNEFLTPLYNIVLYGGMLLFALFFLYRIHPLMFLIAIAMAVFPAVIPQSSFLFNGTVLENITLFSDKWTENEVLAAASSSVREAS